MRTILLVGLFLTTTIWALDGAAIFKQKCTKCHQHYIDKRQLNENYEQNNTILKLKAPPLNQLSFAIKDQIGDRKNDAETQKIEIEEYLESYLKKRDLDESAFADHILKPFLKLPCFSGKLSEEENEALSAYLYEASEEMIKARSVKRYSYDEALKKAKKEGKIILIEGYITYCRGCMKMDQEVMVDEKVKAALNKDFVFVKINALGEKFPLGIKSLGTPSFYFIDSNGTKVLEQVHGSGDVEEFLDLLESVVEDVKEQK